MFAPAARAAVLTATGGVLLRLLGLAALAGIWLALSATRADADDALQQLPADPLPATASGLVDAAPVDVPEPAAPAVDQVTRTVDETAGQVSGPVDRATAQVADTVDRTATHVGGQVDSSAREVTGRADDAVRHVRDQVAQPPAPAPDAGRLVPALPSPTSPGAGAMPPASSPPVEDVESPVLQGDSRSSDAARHRSGRFVDRGATGVAPAVDEPAPATRSAAADSPDAAQQPASPLPLPAPLQLPTSLTATAGAGASGPLQHQLLVVGLLAATLLLRRGTCARVAVPERRRPRSLSLQPGTSPD